MESKKRVLVAGWCQSNFIKQLYSSIHQVAPNVYQFDIYGLNELSGKDEYGIEIFNNTYKVRRKVLLKDLIYLLHPKLIKLVFTFIRYGISAKELVLFVINFLITKSQYKEYELGSYDVVHIHSPVLSNLYLLWHIPDNIKCVVTFWGSDLMRNYGVFNYHVQSEALKRADLITVHGNEMKQQILTKYGRNLDNKIHYTRFPPYDRLYSLIEEKLAKPRSYFDEFLARYNIPAKKIVVIGHNGNPANNHIRIIDSLAGLPKEVKEKLFFILPFSYASSKDGSYEEKCQKAIIEAGLQGIILKNFLSWDDLATFKIITDVMVHMPVSDALSGAVTEAMFSGAKVITGDWLPYSPFAKEGLIFNSTDFENLCDTFTRVFEVFPENELEALKTRAIIKGKFLSDYCAKTWLTVLD